MCTLSQIAKLVEGTSFLETWESRRRREKAWVCFRKTGGCRAEVGSHKISVEIYM